MIRKLTKAELIADKARLDAWLNSLNKGNQLDDERRAHYEDKAIDRNLIRWW